ncbi:hypothetical protein SELMODRAFT_442719 [Selaginella moellendorffii]|uniref:Uncharacterized protein n=1 Tax=Selaginella moellendorffii TaxID=88036 RepID=D8RVJ2_SELML|nr:protein EMBRYO DEFECTIVE 514 [Selaginella moellendorffii]EFJ23781.1 hypothetical protein SELMODRAFT_442719 [Selaginella moellendorffii]|eukprot:XP_002974996.1 protein EMBRYO DEFECTIVE 514 [Selaginella moellendorffii]
MEEEGAKRERDGAAQDGNDAKKAKVDDVSISAATPANAEKGQSGGDVEMKEAEAAPPIAVEEKEGKEEKKEEEEKEEEKEANEGEKKEEEEKKEVKLGPMTFSSGKEMFMYFYELLHGWAADYDMNEYEHMVLLDLLNKGHNDPEAKMGPGGAKAFQIRVHPVWRSRCYYLVRADGTAVDFSYRKCVDKLMPLPQEIFNSSGGLNLNSLHGDGRGGGGGRGRGRHGGGGGGRGRGFRGRGRGRGRSRGY